MSHVQVDRMEKFITHYVWHLSDLQDAQLLNCLSPM